jgi:hypothetical protein
MSSTVEDPQQKLQQKQQQVVVKQQSYKRSWNIAKSLNTFISQKIPVNKFRVSIPCPGYLNKSCLCNGESHEWRCPKCGFYLDSAPSFEYFYCLCGAALPDSYSFRCSNVNHDNNNFVAYNKDDLKVQLDICLKEIMKENENKNKIDDKSSK